MKKQLLLGNEVCARAAVDAGAEFAFGYPGTPSSEILEYFGRITAEDPGIVAGWCTNEKSAFERAMGVSFAGKRVCVTMKHVGLNVAMDAFVNAVMQKIRGGFVVFVADDPGMHSSQNEQDTRYLVRFAKTICFEPGNHDEVYAFSRNAFDVSERFHVPVVVRMVTRLSHSRKVVSGGRKGVPGDTGEPRMADWMCLPLYARRNYKSLLNSQVRMREYSRMFHESRLSVNRNFRTFGVITAGIGTTYFNEILDELPEEPSHLAVGMYPLPEEAIEKLADEVNELIVIEEGYPLIEEQLRSLTDASIQVRGKMDGALPEQGELTPDTVLRLFFPEDVAENTDDSKWPVRSSQLCNGCPHLDTFSMITAVKSERQDLLVMADIGCYTLGALPPYNVLDAALCMGASIGMAHGAADAGNRNVIAIIGDSSFFHSGLPGLFDAVADSAPMVILIVDNSTTAMTGGQDTVLSTERIGQLVHAAGVDEEHVHEITPLPGNKHSNVALLRNELDFKGVSVIISRRECVRMHDRKQRGESFHDH